MVVWALNNILVDTNVKGKEKNIPGLESRISSPSLLAMLACVAVVGLCWPSLAVAGLHWLSSAVVLALRLVVVVVVYSGSASW